MKKSIVVFILIIFCFLSCNSKTKRLTGSSCKYWNTKYIKRESGEFEKKENIGFKICKNGFIDRYYLFKDGDRRKLDFENNIWKIREDSLFTEFDNFEILYLTKDTLVLGRNGDSIYLKNEPIKIGSKIFEAQIKE